MEFEINVENSERRDDDAWQAIFLFASWLVAVITFPFSLFFCVKVISEFSRAVIFRLGRLRHRAFGPGLAWVLPCIDEMRVVDLRTRVTILPTQELLTKDSVTISVDAVLFFYINSTVAATVRVEYLADSAVGYAQAGVRNLVGDSNFHDLLTYREEFSKRICANLVKVLGSWGVTIERLDLKDIRINEALQRSLAQEAESKREAQAKIISAEGEKQASTALKEASEIMSHSSITLQLRELQSLINLARDGGLTIVYPFPMEMMTGFTDCHCVSSKKAPSDNDGGRSSLKLILTLIEPFLRTGSVMDDEQPQASAQPKSGSPNRNKRGDANRRESAAKGTQTDFDDEL